jgi:hypothetical protein
MAEEQANLRRMHDNVSDLPAFYGSDKDNMTADGIITRVDAAVSTLHWEDEDAYNWFAMSLREKAEKWLKYQAVILPEFQRSWNFIKPIFKNTFGIKQDRSKIYSAIKTMQMTKEENPFDYSLRICEVMEMLANCQVAAPLPDLPAVADRTDIVLRKMVTDAVQAERLRQYEIFFTAGLLPTLQTAVISKGTQSFPQTVQTAITIYNVKKDQMGVNGNNGLAAVNEDDEDVNAIGNGTRNPYSTNVARGGNRGRNSYRSNGGQTRGSYHNTGTTGERKCFYCNKPNHNQDVCRTRILDNKPCKNLAGQEYWPRRPERTQAPLIESETETRESSVRTGGQSVFR